MIATYQGIIGTIEVYMKVLRAICGDTAGKSMVDLCCNTAPNTPTLGFEDRLYIDIIDRKLDIPSEQPFFQQMDVLKLEPFPIKNDVAICSDGIEHLTIDDGYRLLTIMDSLAHKQVIFTPTTDLFGLNNDETPEAHRSVWSPGMLPGYASIVFPDYHKVWNGGAFFAWKCGDIEKDFERVIKIIQL